SSGRRVCLSRVSRYLGKQSAPFSTGVSTATLSGIFPPTGERGLSPPRGTVHNATVSLRQNPTTMPSSSSPNNAHPLAVPSSVKARSVMTVDVDIRRPDAVLGPLSLTRLVRRPLG